LLVILNEWLNFIYFFHTPSLRLACVILALTIARTGPTRIT
jgi:hypothetical protein